MKIWGGTGLSEARALGLLHLHIPSAAIVTAQNGLKEHLLAKFLYPKFLNFFILLHVLTKSPLFGFKTTFPVTIILHTEVLDNFINTSYKK